MTRHHLFFIFSLLLVLSARANLEVTGVQLLRSVDPSLTGAGVPVAMAEARISNATPPPFQPNPVIIGQPVSLFTFSSALGSTNIYPNSVGQNSYHAEAVANHFVGASLGVAPGVSHVDVFEADFFYQTYIASLTQPALAARVINQSFIFNTASQALVDSQYDNYAAKHNVLVVSGAGNGTQSGNNGFVNPAATSYNGIGVGVSDGPSSIGPTQDNGRSKPDLVAPGGFSSYSTPLVAGAAAVLIQAGTRGDGGPGSTGAATDIRTLKALLLNGAVKPANWAHSSTNPLDFRYGAGMLNLFNSYEQLRGGRQTVIETTSHSVGANHPPGNNANNVPALRGWNSAALSSTVSSDRVHHYYFNLRGQGSGPFTMTSTLVWNRAENANNIKNLDLFLYNSAGSLVASSVSAVDNVEHLFLPALPPDRYDLQVFKTGGVSNMGTENYALAFEFFSVSLQVERSGTNVVLKWPISPAGFHLQATAMLGEEVWSTVTNTPTVSNGFNHVTLPGVSNRFFRLARP